MTKENLDAVYPNLIEETPEIKVIGSVPDDAVKILKAVAISQIGAVHSHFAGHGMKSLQQLVPVTIKVFLFGNDSYRSPQNAHFVNNLNTWRHNYISRTAEGSGLLVNAAVLLELPGSYHVVVDHEIRHLYVDQVVGREVLASSFPLREGCMGLCIDSTERLKAILERGDDGLYLPLSITNWDRQLDKEEHTRRCFIDNPWYLSMFSFFHDFIGIKRDGLARLIQVFPTVAALCGNLELAWKKTYSDRPTLKSLQEEWVAEEGLSRFRINE
ncbi:hypothetical protein KJ641_00810 [Patescibacteria group bacterium]|nr:hypothetical protein [Patescibacteria group bacterium]